MGGVIVAYKPVGISSNSFVNLIKKEIKAKKAGHLGTLDVLGEGILPITINKATRLFDYYLTKNKTYKAVFCFGFETKTLDLEGEIVKINKKIPSIKELKRSIKNFIGRYNQLPPEYSSKKINGQTAYQLARSGKAFILKEKEVEINSIKIKRKINNTQKKILLNRFLKYHYLKDKKEEYALKCFNNKLFEFEINCGAGTYIRSLCRDIAKNLSTCGTMLHIIRTKCGNFTKKQSYTLEDIRSGNYKLIPAFKAVDFPKLKVDKKILESLLNGKKVILEKISKGNYNLFCKKNYIGICNVSNSGLVKIKTFLMEDL